jgi:hypothetical protein
LFLSDLPRLGDAHSVILDRGIALHLRVNRDHDLARGVALELFQPLVELPSGGGGNHAGIVVEIMRRHGRDGLGGQGRQPEHSAQNGEKFLHRGDYFLLKSNCTWGGFSAPVVAAK